MTATTERTPETLKAHIDDIFDKENRVKPLSRAVVDAHREQWAADRAALAQQTARVDTIDRDLTRVIRSLNDEVAQQTARAEALERDREFWHHQAAILDEHIDGYIKLLREQTARAEALKASIRTAISRMYLEDWAADDIRDGLMAALAASGETDQEREQRVNGPNHWERLEEKP